MLMTTNNIRYKGLNSNSTAGLCTVHAGHACRALAGTHHSCLQLEVVHHVAQHIVNMLAQDWQGDALLSQFHQGCSLDSMLSMPPLQRL